MNLGAQAEYFTIATLISDRARTQPDALAIIDGSGKSYSYSDLQYMLLSWRCSLQSIGLSIQSRIAVAMPQGAELGLVFLATAASATFVPLNPEYTETEFFHYLSRMKVAALLTTWDSCPEAESAANKLGVPVLHVEKSDAGVTLVAEQFSSEASIVNSAQQFQSSENIAILLHTSGSTSEPKLVPLIQSQILCSARSIVSSLGLNSKDRCLNSMPLFHVGALVDLILAPLMAGGSAIITSDSSVCSFRYALENFQPTWYQGVPAMLQNILNVDIAEKKSELRFIRAVSAPLPEKLLHDVETAFGVPVIEMYGMTETSGLICSNPLPPVRRKVGSVGLPVDHEVLVMDDTGNSAAVFKTGEIIVKGKSVICAYEDDDELNQEQFSAGWFHTGDIGYFDDEGYLFLAGRLKELINRGGEKISPAEVDRCILLHESVVEAGTFSVPHQTLGEDVNAAVVLTVSDAVDEEELLKFLKGRISDFKIPRRIYFLEALPKNSSGKLLRSKIAECCIEAGAGRRKDNFIAPESKLAILLAGMWQKALNVPRVGLNDSFFELGGDSLKATTFLVDLQKKLGSDIAIPSLYESPTIAAIEQDILMNTGRSVDELVANIAGLSPEIYLDVYRSISAVRGKRRSPESLILGMNTLGKKTPIFFSTGMDKKLLRQLFGPDQPIYIMRSLLDLPSRTTDKTIELARYYAREIQEIQPEGPVILGGFCEGGKIAFEVARELRSNQRDVPLLFMMEQFVPRLYDGRVEMFFSKNSRFYPYRYFQNPEKGWRKYYSGDMAVTIYPCEHTAFLDKTFLNELVEKLQQDIPMALRNGSPYGNVEISKVIPGLQVLSDEDRLLEVNAKTKWIVSQDAELNLDVTVTNLSQQDWLSYEESGLFLAVRWVDRENRVVRWVDREKRVWDISGRANLISTLKPGETVSFSISVKTPQSRGFMELDIDMVEEDVCFFQDVTYQFNRQPVFVGNIFAFVYHSARRLFRA